MLGIDVYLASVFPDLINLKKPDAEQNAGDRRPSL